MILLNDNGDLATQVAETKSQSQCGAEVIALEKQLCSIVPPKKRGPQMLSVGF